MVKKTITTASGKNIEIETEGGKWGFQAGDIITRDTAYDEVSDWKGKIVVVEGFWRDWLCGVSEGDEFGCVAIDPKGLILLERLGWQFKVGDRVRHHEYGVGTVIILDPTSNDGLFPYLVTFVDCSAGSNQRPYWSSPWFPERYQYDNKSRLWRGADSLEMMVPVPRDSSRGAAIEPLPVRSHQAEEALSQGLCEARVVEMQNFASLQEELVQIAHERSLLEKQMLWVKAGQEMLRIIVETIHELSLREGSLPIFYPYGEDRSEFREASHRRAKDEQEALHSIGVWLYHQITGASEWTHLMRFYKGGKTTKYPKLEESHRFAEVVNVLTEEEHEWNSEQVEQGLAELEARMVETIRELSAQKQELFLQKEELRARIVELEARIVEQESAVLVKEDLLSELRSGRGPLWGEGAIMLSSPVRNESDAVQIQSQDEAQEILGKNKVLSAFLSNFVQGRVEKLRSNIQIFYSRATLLQCAEENAAGEADWRLVYINGLSLREQREFQGVDPQRQPCFYADHVWWLKEKESFWAERSPTAGYYLVNFKGQFGNRSWYEQQELIAGLGEQFERCNEHVFAEAIQAIFLTTDGDDARIAENWFHWGWSLDCENVNNGCVAVGEFDNVGIGVFVQSRKDRNPMVYVCVSRKWDF